MWYKTSALSASLIMHASEIGLFLPMFRGIFYEFATRSLSLKQTGHGQ